ncbi:MAG: hypothetical protein HKUEN07_07910 [Rhodocyclaceae bacterium]|nr:MAG: hypothetical protein HKUEN07_07910 [Rhodocyclaceae bacterium]
MLFRSEVQVIAGRAKPGGARQIARTEMKGTDADIGAGTAAEIAAAIGDLDERQVRGGRPGVKGPLQGGIESAGAVGGVDGGADITRATRAQ